MHIKFMQTVLYLKDFVPIRTKNLKVVLDRPGSCVGERVDMTRVWCLVAEGDYVRIKVSLCLWRSETEVEDDASH